MSYDNARNRYNADGAGVVPQNRLLVMLYDRLVLDLEQADAALVERSIEVVNDKLLHAQAIILELHSALDIDAWDGSEGLASLYVWLNEQLLEANVKKDARGIRNSLRVVRQLRDAWRDALTAVTTSAEVAPQAAVPSNIAG